MPSTPSEKGRPAELQKQMDQIGDRFLQRLLAELAMMRELLLDVRAGDAGALHDLELFAHKIHGSGAMFGLATLSRTAADFEAALVRGRAAGTDLAASLPLLEEHFRLLESEGRAAVFSRRIG